MEKIIKLCAISGLMLVLFGGCERSVSNLEEPDFSTNPNIFIDGFSTGLNFAAFAGSVPAAFQVDTEVTFGNSDASMRFEVPDVNDPRGAFAGGAYFTDSGRNLTQYDALTFWIKSSVAATIDVAGFGNDFAESRFQVSLSGLRVNTNWQKVIIPIPDPSKLTSERGMLFLSEGPENERGYTFWVDEVKFENLGTVVLRQFSILNGEDQVDTSFEGVSKSIVGLNSIFNLPTGIDRAVNLTPAYFEFSSSDESIATVNSSGVVTITGGPGSAKVTASIGNETAEGSLTIESRGAFQPAPVPSENPDDVISIFSNVFDNEPVDFFNGFFEPFQTTTSEDFTVNGDDVLFYTNFNFVGIQFANPTIDATSMTHLRMDIFFPNDFGTGVRFQIELISFGPDGAFGGGDDSSQVVTFTRPFLVDQEWISFDIPLSSFSAINDFSNIAQIIYIGENIPGFFADNIYFRK